MLGTASSSGDHVLLKLRLVGTAKGEVVRAAEDRLTLDTDSAVTLADRVLTRAPWYRNWKFWVRAMVTAAAVSLLLIYLKKRGALERRSA